MSTLNNYSVKKLSKLIINTQEENFLAILIRTCLFVQVKKRYFLWLHESGAYRWGRLHQILVENYSVSGKKPVSVFQRLFISDFYIIIYSVYQKTSD